MDTQYLQFLVSQRLTQRQIANTLGTSQTNVRYWLKKLDLRTNPVRVGCCEHGVIGCAVCKRGSAAQVTARRIKLKQMIVEERGGRCQHPSCPVDPAYRFDLGDLDFHHRDRLTKTRALGNWSQSEVAYRQEAAKCDLLCALCHRRVEREVRALVV